MSEKENTFVAMTLRPVGVASKDVTLDEFKVTGGKNGWMYSKDYISTIKPNGCNDKFYGYVSAFWAGEDGFDDPSLEGWWDLAVCKADFEVDPSLIISRNNVKLDAGQAIIVYTSMADMELLIPSPLD